MVVSQVCRVATVFQNLAKFAQHLPFISFLCSRVTREYKINLLLLTPVAILFWFGLVQPLSVQRESHEGVAHSAPTGQGLESIQKIAELILNCRGKESRCIAESIFLPTPNMIIFCCKGREIAKHHLLLQSYSF